MENIKKSTNFDDIHHETVVFPVYVSFGNCSYVCIKNITI